MPLHPQTTEDDKHAICTFCFHSIGTPNEHGDFEYGILLQCGHLHGDLCLAENARKNPPAKCPQCGRLILHTLQRPDTGILNIPATSQPSTGQSAHAVLTPPTSAAILRMPHWLEHESNAPSISDVVRSLRPRTFTAVAGMRHRTVYPGRHVTITQALYTASEVDEIAQLISLLSISAALTGIDIERSLELTVRNCEQAPHEPDAARLWQLLSGPLRRRYNTGISAFVALQGPGDVPLTDLAGSQRPISESAWFSPPPSSPSPSAMDENLI